MSELKSTGSLGGDSFGQLQIGEYLGLLRRRKWWIVLTTIALFLIVVVVAIRMPNQYKAHTIILVDPQKVAERLVPSLVSTTFEARLARIQQEILSPPRLAMLIDNMNLYPELRGKVDQQDIVAKFQKSLVVEMVNQADRPVTAFRIAFHGKNPAQVAQVTNQLASMFIQRNLEDRGARSAGTTEFLENELDKTKKELSEKERELQSLKSRNIMALPDSKVYHVQALESLRAQLRASQDRLDRAQQERMYWQSTTAAPAVDMDEAGSPYQSQLQKLETNLSQLRSRYGPKHPDVRKAQAELDALRAREAEERKNAVAAAVTPERRKARNPVVEAQMQKLNDDVQKETKLQADLQRQIDLHVSDLQRQPMFENQIVGLMRDYDTLRAHYTALLDKKMAADMASNLENSQEAERFVIQSPAQIPEKPFAPNRLLIALAGLLGGLMGGIGLAVLAEMGDESVRSEREASRILSSPVLVAIPRIRTPREVVAERSRALLAIAGTAVCSLALGLVIAHFSRRFF